MDKKVQKPFMYLRNGELLYDSEGKEAMAEKQAADIIDIIKKINPNLGDANDEDVTKDEIEDTDNDSSQEIDWGAKIIDVFKNGCLKWKPSLEKDHKSLLTTKAHTNFTRKTYSEDNKIKETKVMYGEADANFNASSSGNLKISMGEKNYVKAEYDAKVNGCGEASCNGLFDKRSNDKENERELLIAKSEAKGKLEGEFKGSASFNAKENEGKADMNVKFGVHGQTSFTGVDIKLKNSNKEGRVKVLHGNAKGNAEIKAAGTFGKHKVNLEAKAKGGAKFKAMDGEFDFSAKKRNDGIYIPGLKGIVGKAKAKGEAEFSLNADICGRKIDKKGNVSGEAEASALSLNALEVDIRKEKDDGTVRKAKASVKGMEGNFCNVEATGKRSGDITEASATLTGAKVNIGNVNATGIDNRTIHSANATSGLSADIGNVKASGLGHKGATAGIDASLGMQMFNVSAGIARDTGVSASSKFSMFNVNLTIGTPSLNISMPGLGPNISIPFASAGGGGGHTADQSNDSNGKGKNETGSFTGQEKENGSNNEGSLNTNSSNKEGSLNTDGNIGTKSSGGEPSQCGSIAQNNTNSCTNSRFGNKSYIGNESNTSLDYEEQSLTSLNDCIGTCDGDGGPVENGVIAEDNTGRYTKDGLGSGTCIGNIRERCPNSEETNLSSLDLNDYIESCDDDVGISEIRSIAGDKMGSCTDFGFGSGPRIGNEREGCSIGEGTKNRSFDFNDCIETCDEDVCFLERRSVAKDNIGSCTNTGLGSGSPIGNEREDYSISEGTNLNCIHLNDYIESCDGDVEFSESRSIAGDNMDCCTNFGFGSGSRIGNEREGCSISEGTKDRSLDLNDCIETCDEDVGFLERRPVTRDNMGSCTNTGFGSGSRTGNEREGCSTGKGTKNRRLDLNDCIETCDGDLGSFERRSIAGSYTNNGFGSGSCIGNEGSSISKEQTKSRSTAMVNTLSYSSGIFEKSSCSKYGEINGNSKDSKISTFKNESESEYEHGPLNQLTCGAYMNEHLNTKNFEGQVYVRKHTIGRPNKNPSKMTFGDTVSAEIEEAEKEDQHCLKSFETALCPKHRRNITNEMHGDEQTAEQVDTKTCFKGTDRQAEDLKTQINSDDILDIQTGNEQEHELYTQLPKRKHGKSPKHFGMHHRTSGLSSTDTSQENDVQTKTEDLLRTSGKYSSASNKMISTDFKDDEYYNKYLASLVNDRFDKSKGKYKNTESEKTAKSESLFTIWSDQEKLKQALVEKYSKGPNARDVTAKRNSVGNTKERDIEGNAAQGQSTESDDRTPKAKKKEEPKKPFGANKNIHTIFTLAGAESKPVKYLKDNFACFTDE